MAMDSGKLILLLASQDVQTAQQLATRSTLSLAETTRQLQGLLTAGFILASDPHAGLLVYRLAARDMSPTALAPEHRVLVIDDEIALLELVVTILEDDGYAVLAATTPVDGAGLLQHVTFDVVITDGFSRTPAAVLTSVADVLQFAGATPVALFSAHRIELEAAHAAGLHALIQKPFDVDELLAVVKRLQLHEG